MKRTDLEQSFLAGMSSLMAVSLNAVVSSIAGAVASLVAVRIGMSTREGLLVALIAALLCFVGLAILHGWRSVIAADPAMRRSFWLDAEARFAAIDGEVDAHASLYDDGHVEWNVHVSTETGGSVRARERFLAEAVRLGEATRGQKIERKFDVSVEDDDDRWLNVVVALVKEQSRYEGPGRNERGDYTSFSMVRAVHASRTACAIMAADARAD